MTKAPLFRNLVIVALCVAADQAIKALVVATMALGEMIELVPFFALYHTRNTGIAFSMFSGLDDVWLALLAGVVLLGVLWIWWKTPADRTISHLGLAVIVGGAIGNLIDRSTLGYVVDYAFFHTPVWSFAVFNLADAFITVGAVLILADEFILAPRRARESRQPG